MPDLDAIDRLVLQFHRFSLDELRRLVREAQQAIGRREEEERIRIRQQMEELAQSVGMTIE